MKHEPFISEVKHSMVFFRVGLTLNLEETRTAEARHGYCVLARNGRDGMGLGWVCLSFWGVIDVG